MRLILDCEPDKLAAALVVAKRWLTDNPDTDRAIAKSSVGVFAIQRNKTGASIKEVTNG